MLPFVVTISSPFTSVPSLQFQLWNRHSNPTKPKQGRNSSPRAYTNYNSLVYNVLDICDKSAWSKRLTQFFPSISDYSCLFHLRGETEGVRENCVGGRVWVDCLLDHITWWPWLFEFQFEFDDGKNGFFAVTVQPTNWFNISEETFWPRAARKNKAIVNLSPTNTIKFPIG